MKSKTAETPGNYKKKKALRKIKDDISPTYLINVCKLGVILKND